MDAETPRLQLLIERAQGTLLIDCSDVASARLKERLQELAAELLVEWIVGERRFESQSQQSEYWLSRFYDEIFTDEQPDATRIYERFGISLSRANYIARLLRARRAAQWRHAARRELRAQLEKHQEAVAEAQKEGMAHTEDFDISLSSGAADELRVVFDRMSDAAPRDERPRPPRLRPGFGSTKWFGVPGTTVLALLEAIPEGHAE
jgi:hypothetical protein